MIWVHNINPVILHIYKNIAIRWYPLAYILGFIAAFIWIHYLIKNNYLDLNKKELDDFIFYLFLGVLLGGRIFYMIFYQFELLLKKPFELFMVWHGGMSFHGGFIGILFFTYLFSKKYNKNLWKLYGSLAVVAPVGLFFGRIANFINGELWGKPTNGEWGIIFPEAGPLPRHPSQLYEAFLEGLILFIILFIIFKSTRKLKYLGPYFGMGYSTFRIIVELFREPDRQLGYLILKPITMGQILSLIMFLFSVYIFYIIRKKEGF
ncbi:MAG: prolipoprotein diacylglyceryl transferase [Candidatus Mcinerneyibacterium aminivorans]|uniref:Phosphatidylglycerol--prolipoprotein diacylglyceryl transferase n=1 Tax=Candidatus Mcinerneyibacterium aminivorans TaxID=2703815 RepID=A0A5D0MJ98_9BACT|nr:MAG: prolipoprotein diacylglyceryl transferase [Candidatus Mcinerneyibacterium aminivorans]